MTDQEFLTEIGANFDNRLTKQDVMVSFGLILVISFWAYVVYMLNSLMGKGC